MRTRGLLTTVAALLAALLLVTLLPTTAGARPDGRPTPGASITPREAPQSFLDARRRRSPLPVLWGRSFGDPSVAATSWGYVAVATGWGVPMSSAYAANGPWVDRGPALTRLPTWALDEPLWAADIERINGRWVMYYSARVAGLGRSGRCIGVAVSTSPLGGFTPVDRAPLVCPRRATTPRAGDLVPRRGRGLSKKAGVIDPSVFRDRGGRLHLLYKTQGFPSSIRMVRLNGHGLTARRKAPSRRLVRDPGTVENPVLVRRGKKYFLFTSQGNYGGCRYRTEWRRSKDLWSWKDTRPRVLLNRKKTGLCGPGGADVVAEPALGTTTIFFHGWVCYRTELPCRGRFNYKDPFGPPSNRAMYAARLGFKGGAPRIKRYLRPG
ncbi:family 43 glycosylhydrolase [Nocardioides sp.]|uniref:family 43 glycosylhydrolase n=1 Tax=Nocardioides sp. TaxID=35761 RepID=UPI0027341CC6|nr:family 43 glycosylhydrolase [Nocardioides sp.]MDP3893710.1 family 43 glycosylhydrolase [Nocardioides sp.]